MIQRAVTGARALHAIGDPSRTRLRPPRVVVTVPTFNEAGNIDPLVRALLALGENYQVLVVDDDSPDGTGAIVERLARSDARVHLLLRTEDPGRGRSGRDGFVRALSMGADVVVEMDADFSHQPRYIPAMIEKLDAEGLGLVLGSRGVAGGRDADRGAFRRWLTIGANGYIRLVLGVPVRDCNSGFRVWRRETLEAIDVASTFSKGPAIVQELLFKTQRAGIRIGEHPIVFENRQEGESTLTLRKLVRGYVTVLQLRAMSLRRRL